MRYPILLALAIIVLLAGSLAYAATIPSLKIVVYRDGKPLADATVELWANKTLVARAITDGNGTVVFTNVSTGNYTIYVYHNGSVWRFDRVVDANTTSITLNLTGNDDSLPPRSIDLDNKWYLATAVGAGLLILVFLAYALSGKRIPRRR